MTSRFSIVAISAFFVALLFACQSCSRTASNSAEPEAATTSKTSGARGDILSGGAGPAPADADVQPDSAAVEPEFFRTAVDLRNNRYLAHLHRDGLFIPLNDPGVTKYLPAQTRSGLQAHKLGSKDTLRVTGRHAVLSVSLDRRDCVGGCWLYLALEQRMKKQYLGIFVNKQALQTQAIPEGRSLARVHIPPGAIVDGENRFRFYFARKGIDGGKKVSADLLWLSIRSSEDEGLKPAMSFRRIVKEGGAGLNFRDFSAWSWNLAVPPASHLQLGWGGGGSCPIRLVAQAPGEEARIMAVSHSGPGQARFDLRELISEKGGVVRIRLERIREAVLHDVRIVVPHQPMRALGKPLPRKVVVWVSAGLGAEHTSLGAFDGLKKRGVLFPDAVTQSPTPWRSLTGILSGLDPHVARQALSDSPRKSKAKLLPWLLKKKNWITALFSGEAKFRKADIGRAFQEIYDFQPRATDEPGKAFLPHLDTWLESNKEKPFFVLVAPWSRQAYYRNREGYTEASVVDGYRGTLGKSLGGLTFSKLRTEKRKLRIRDRKYIEALIEGEAAFQDKLLGELVTKLQELEIHKETLLVVVGASGVELFEHEGVGLGHSLHRETTTVPMLFVHPGSLPEGVEVHTGAELLDVAPTVLSAAGFMPLATMKGANLLNLVKNGFMSPPRSGFSRRNAFEHSIKLGQYRLMRSLGEVDRVFDLRADPEEKKPIVDSLDPAVCALRDAMAFHTRYGKRWRKARHGLPSNQSETFAEDSKSWWGNK